MDPTRCAILNNGILMPKIGLGVYQTVPGDETRRAVLAALSSGYRHLDTAAVYRNETDVGAALKESGLHRRDVFLTTKLASSDHGYDSALRAFDESLRRLGVEKIDLYLIHWPGHPARRESWRALERLYSEKRVRAIGVSNYTVAHLEEVLKYCQIIPAVNQVEFNPFLYQKALLEFCQTHAIQLEAYAPLTQARRLNHRSVQTLAQKYRKTPAQILLRWGLERDLVVIPKSRRPDRIAENYQVFDFSLTPQDLHELDALDENLRTCWDPTHVK